LGGREKFQPNFAVLDIGIEVKALFSHAATAAAQRGWQGLTPGPGTGSQLTPQRRKVSLIAIGPPQGLACSW